MRLWVAMMALALAGAVTALAQNDRPATAPKPSIVRVAWELDFKPERPEPIAVTLPGQDKPRTFWYMRYRVTNHSGEDRIFVPDFVLYTDNGQVLHAGDKIPSAVFAAIVKRHNDPLLVDYATITGKLLQGDDNAKDGVAIWQDIDPEARAFDVFCGGLSGEHVKMPLPAPVTVTVKEDGKPVQVTKTEAVLEKTLKLHFIIPSEAAARGHNLPQLIKTEWVMR